jgi:hypothetical protein
MHHPENGGGDDLKLMRGFSGIAVIAVLVMKKVVRFFQGDLA